MKSLTAIVSRPASRRVLAMLALSLAVVGHSQAQELKIGFVRADRISDSAPAKAAMKKLESEFSKRGQEMQAMEARLKAMADKLDKDFPVLSESDRSRRQRELAELDKEFQRKKREINEDFSQRRNEEIATVNERASTVIKQIAEKEKFDLILQEAVFVSNRIDITDKVLSVLNK